MSRPATRSMAWLGGLILGPVLGLALAVQAAAEVPVQDYEVVAAYPHDRDAFTQGLFVIDGALFETTGLYPSTLRQVRLDTGEVLRRRELPTVYFGEGATALDGRIYSLTWRNRMGFIWRPDDFVPLGGFTYPGEGWGVATPGRRRIMHTLLHEAAHVGREHLDVVLGGFVHAGAKVTRTCAAAR